jgi:uncharacterized membrane protein
MSKGRFLLIFDILTFCKHPKTMLTQPAPKTRIASIDLLRGLVMLIMAIDHVRDNFLRGSPDPTDLLTTTPLLFFTRWITHFCAPTFVFLSGISAFLAGTRRSATEMSSFLFKRGIWLILVEVFIVSRGIAIDPTFQVAILQVIWAIGGSMILLGLLLRFKASLTVIGIIGGCLFCGHDLLNSIVPASIQASWYGKLFLFSVGPAASDIFKTGHFYIMIAYALLPWTGVMLLGYVFGSVYKSGFDAAMRRKILLYNGLGLLALFLVFRGFNLYGDPAPWSLQKNTVFNILSFLNVTKYPCSLHYLSMTIGVALVVLACTEKVANRFTAICIVYGNVPFFYYVIHWYLIDIIHVIIFFAMGYRSGQIVNPHSRFPFEPDGWGFSLGGVYLVWLAVVVIMYRPCKWFGNYKRTHSQWWLSYL